MSDEATLDEFAMKDNEQWDLQSTPTGNYVSDWSVVRSGDYFSFQNGKFLKGNKRSDDAEYPVYGGNGIMGYTSDANVSEGKIVIGRVGAYCGNIHKTDSKAWVTDNSIILTNDSESFSNEYLRYLLTSVNLGQFSEQSAQPRISQSTVANLRIPNPPLPEQRKIATVLYTVDRAIEKTKEIESQVRRTQGGIVQKSLKYGLGESDISDTGTKLGEIPTHWEVTSIDEIVADEEHSFTDGARYSLSSAEIHDEGEARAILLQEVGEGEFNDEDPKFATGEKYEEITHRAIYPGEVVVAKMAEPVARACIVPDKYDKYLLGCADVVRVQTNDEFDSRFLMYCMNSHKIWRQAVAHLRGTGRSRINLENIAELKLPKPPLSEQMEIADSLESFDKRIQTECDYRNGLQRLKRGLMQDLLSGKVRTTDTNIEVPEEVAQHG